MKSFIVLVTIIGVIVSSCGPQKATRSDMSKLDEARANAEKAKENLANTQNASQIAADELAKKKDENEKSKDELRKVRANLKKMGQWADYMPFNKENNTLLLPGGVTRTIRKEITDTEALTQLNAMLDAQATKQDKDHHALTTCIGGFETCLNGKIVVLYFTKDDAGACKRTWYETENNCD